MDVNVRHLFIEINKTGDGYDATLSDDSIDRDNEFFSSELIKVWGNEGTTLPFLVDHVNSMKNLVGGWTNRTVVEANGHTMLKMTPQFFSEKANPLAAQIKQQIDEAKAMGLMVGLSIGFIPKKGMMVDNRFMHTDAELLEGSAVPVQSNRHAGISLAKALKLASNDFLKPSDNRKSGGNMAEGETQAATPAPATEIKSSDLLESIKALQAEVAELKATASGFATVKEMTEAKEKLAAMEKKNAEEMAKYSKQLEDVNATLNKPKGKVPSAMLGNVGTSKEATGADTKTFDATKAWAKLRNLEVE